MKKSYNLRIFKLADSKCGGSDVHTKSPVFNIDPMLYNERSLNLLTIRDLRDIGRKFGVPSPTTLSKSDLVDYILKIVYGEIKVPERKLSGRPNVREFNMQSYLDRIRKNSSISDELSRVRLFSDFGEMKVSSTSSEYVSSVEAIETRVLCEDGGKFYLRNCAYIASEVDIEVNKEIIKKFGLEPYDVLEIIESGGLFKIVTINGIRVKDKFKGLQVMNEPVVSGTNKVFYMKTKEETKTNIEVIASICAVNDVPLMLFAKNNYVGKTLNCLSYGEETSSLIYKKFMQFLGECERVTSLSGDTVLLVEDLKDILDAIGSFESDVAFRIKSNIKERLIRFSKLGNVCILLSSDISSLY